MNKLIHNSDRARLMRLYEADSSITEYYSKAVPMYEETLQEQPDSVEDLFDLGYLHERRSWRLQQEAAEIYKHALKYASKKKDAEPSYYKVLAHLTRTYIKRNMTHQAIQLVKELVLADPADARLYCALCNCYMQAGQPDDAEKTIDAALKLDGASAYVLYFAGEVAKLKERYEQALQYWNESYEKDDSLYDNLFSIAFLLDYLKRYEESIAMWKQIERKLLGDGGDIEAQMPRDEIAKMEAKIQAQKDGKEAGN